MYKAILAVVAFVFILASSKALPQVNSSFQVNGGLIMPLNSSKGFTSSVQFNYPLSDIIQLYAYTGYSAWDKHIVRYHKEYVSGQSVSDLDSYSEDNHILIPLYIGAKINFNKNKIFTSFVNFETGYSYFRYNSYENYLVTNINTGEVVSFLADEKTKKENTENLFGIGLGVGISSPLTKNIDLILAFRLNTGYKEMLSAKNTFTAVTAGINFGL